MRHSYFGKKLSRTKNERRNLFRNLMRDLFLHGQIKTTKAKAKAVQGQIDKLITKAKTGKDEKKREIFSVIPDKDVVEKIMLMAKDRFSPRTSGYTRIIQLGVRRGDATSEVLLSFVDSEIKPIVKAAKPSQKKEEVKIPNVEKKESKARKVAAKKK